MEKAISILMRQNNSSQISDGCISYLYDKLNQQIKKSLPSGGIKRSLGIILLNGMK